MSNHNGVGERAIRVGIVDDYEVARWGFKKMCETFDGIDCVGIFEDGAHAVEYCDKHPVDVLLMDILMPKKNGIEVTLEIMRKPRHPAIIAFTSHHKREYLQSMIHAGVSGYMPKSVGKADIQTAIQTVARGGMYFSPEIQADMVELVKGNAEDSNFTDITSSLTRQELKILSLISKGHSNKELASKLYISPRTVETHKRNVSRKLGITNSRKLYSLSLKFFGARHL